MEENIIFRIEFDEEEVQSFAEDNFERELTEVELNRIRCHWYEDGAAYSAKTELLARAIEVAMNKDRKIDFSYTDKKYLEQTNK